MSAKYYTHFLMNRQPSANEFTGVVELTRPPRRGYNLKEVAAILAKSLHVQSADIRILHWSRLH